MRDYCFDDNFYCQNDQIIIRDTKRVKTINNNTNNNLDNTNLENKKHYIDNYNLDQLSDKSRYYKKQRKDDKDEFFNKRISKEMVTKIEKETSSTLPIKSNQLHNHQEQHQKVNGNHIHEEELEDVESPKPKDLGCPAIDEINSYDIYRENYKDKLKDRDHHMYRYNVSHPTFYNGNSDRYKDIDREMRYSRSYR